MIVHPDTISTIFRLIVIPKVLYDLENANLTKTKQERQVALTAFLGPSTHSENFLHEVYYLKNLTDLLTNCKLNVLNVISCFVTRQHQNIF